MKLWVVRHGQTELNRRKLMQGRSDIPLNDTGISQARAAAGLAGDVVFDAVFSSPLIRAVQTASIISRFPEDKIMKDPRLLETDFGKYEKRSYFLLGPFMTLYWALPEVFPAPPTVESVSSMVSRSSSFIKDLEHASYENVLISGHGGIIRALCGCLENRPKGIAWRPKPHNCEFRIYLREGSGWKRL